MNRRFRFLSSRSPRTALFMGLAAFAVLTTATYLRQSERIAHPTLRGDSLQYFRDALFLQHRLFNLPNTPEIYIAQAYKELQLRLPGRGLIGFRFGDKVVHSLYNAALLQASDGNIRIIFFSNLIVVGLSFCLAAYCLTREFGIMAGALGIFSGTMVSTGNTIPTILLEPNISLMLTTLAFAAWLVLRGRGGGLASLFLAVTCVLAILLKSSLIPFACMGALLCGVMIAGRSWRRTNGRRPGPIILSLAAIFLMSLVSGAAYSAKEIARRYLDLKNSAFQGANGPYALWMGSLPTNWTGVYSGRLSTQFFHFANDARADPEYRRQYLSHPGYFFPMRDAWRDILHNYLDYPLDALARVAFRYTRLIRTNGFEKPVHAIVGFFSIVGCIAIVVQKRVRLLPWVIVLQGIVWLHTLSRYRARDEEQCITLIGLTAAVGVVCLVDLAAKTFRRRRLSTVASSAFEEGTRHRSGSRLLKSCRVAATAILLLPVALSIAFPDTQSIRKPRIDLVRSWITTGSNPRLNVEARLENQYQFARLTLRRGREKRMWLSQSGEDGRIYFSVPTDTRPFQDDVRIGLNVWSLTGRENSYRITDVDHANE